MFNIAWSYTETACKTSIEILSPLQKRPVRLVLRSFHRRGAENAEAAQREEGKRGGGEKEKRRKGEKENGRRGEQKRPLFSSLFLSFPLFSSLFLSVSFSALPLRSLRLCSEKNSNIIELYGVTSDVEQK
ncbi:MAG TPA: hypothetical protein VJ810_22005 [Blastocatellia bacterium]|nr:hypothetical protein [Blastocatellia bacterium]